MACFSVLHLCISILRPTPILRMSVYHSVTTIYISSASELPLLSAAVYSGIPQTNNQVFLPPKFEFKAIWTAVNACDTLATFLFSSKPPSSPSPAPPLYPQLPRGQPHPQLQLYVTPPQPWVFNPHSSARHNKSTKKKFEFRFHMAARLSVSLSRSLSRALALPSVSLPLCPLMKSVAGAQRADAHECRSKLIHSSADFSVDSSPLTPCSTPCRYPTTFSSAFLPFAEQPSWRYAEGRKAKDRESGLEQSQLIAQKFPQLTQKTFFCVESLTQVSWLADKGKDTGL